MLGLAIGDVESRRHLVAVLSLKATSGETDALHHVGIDDRESFLLSAADEERAVDLHIVYIYRVLIKGPATHIVLRRQFRVCRHACLALHEFLHGITRCRGRSFHVFGAELLSLSRLYLLSCDIYLSERVAHAVERHLQSLWSLGLSQYTRLRAVAEHRELHHHRVGGVKRKAVVAVSRGHRGLALLQA